MELIEFAQLIADDSTTTAKNTLSYLIGNGKVNNNWNKALANLYKSFPSSIKETNQQKKEFCPVLLKYFYTYSITEDNIDIFNEYIDFFSAADKDKLKEKNSSWAWSNEVVVVFKNTLEFSRAIPCRGQNNDIFEFINKYKLQLNQFLDNPKTKLKLIENFSKHAIWVHMIKVDYSNFSDFCNNYNINKYDILQNTINISTNFGNSSVIKEKNIDLFLSDINTIGKKCFANIKDFYPKYATDMKDNDKNVLRFLLDIIQKNEFTSAIKYMQFFQEELNQYGNKLEVKNDIFSKNGFQQILNEQKKINGSSYQSSSVNNILNNVLNNQKWFVFLQNYVLMTELDSTLDKSNTNKTNKIKI